MVLEKTLESPLDCKEIQPVHSEGDQPWDFFAEAQTRLGLRFVLFPGPSSSGDEVFGERNSENVNLAYSAFCTVFKWPK